MPNVNVSEEFMARARAAKSFEELKSLVAAEGIEVTGDELMAKWGEYCGEGKSELSDDELENVAGGCGGPKKTRGTWALCNGAHYSSSPMPKVSFVDDDHACGNCQYFERDAGSLWSGSGICTYKE